MNDFKAQYPQFPQGAAPAVGDTPGDKMPAATASTSTAQGSAASNRDDCDVCDDPRLLLAPQTVRHNSTPDVASELVSRTTSSEPRRPAERVPRAEFIVEPGNLAADVVRAQKLIVDSGLNIFVHEGRPVIVLRRGPSGSRAVSEPVELTTDLVRVVLTSLAEFKQLKRRRLEAIHAPTALARAVLEAPVHPFRELRRVVIIPTLLPDGKLIDRPGFHEASGIFYGPALDSEVAAGHEAPTLEDAQAAVTES